MQRPNDRNDHPRVMVVIPAHNEAATVAEVVRGALAFAPVIVVDDGSTDGTADRLAGLPVTVLRNDRNLGKAASLWRGAMHALAQGADAVITLDADGQHDPADIPRLLQKAEEQPDAIVIAARLRNRQATPPLRLFGNRMANFWISWAAGHPIADTQSGFRLYPREVLEQVNVRHDHTRGFVFESEILVDAAQRGFRIAHIETEAIYPPNLRPSHYIPRRDTTAIILMVAGRLLRRGLDPIGLLRSLRLLPPRRPAASGRARTRPV